MFGIVAYLAVLMGTRMGTAYYSLALLLIPLGGLAWFFYKKKVLHKILNQLKENWGRKDDRKRDFKEIGSLFQFLGA